MIMPIDMANPPSVIKLAVSPTRFMIIKVSRMVRGKDRTTIRELLKLRRNMNNTMITNNAPKSRASTIVRMLAVTISVLL